MNPAAGAEHDHACKHYEASNPAHARLVHGDVFTLAEGRWVPGTYLRATTACVVATTSSRGVSNEGEQIPSEWKRAHIESIPGRPSKRRRRSSACTGMETGAITPTLMPRPKGPTRR